MNTPSSRIAGWLLPCLVALAAAAASAQGPGPTMVTAAKVVARDVPPAVKLVGTVRPDKTATLAAEVPGIIESFVVDEGTFVEPGDVICKLDDTVASLRIDEADATLKSLEARLEELEAGERPEDLARLKARVAETEADYQKWEYELEWVTSRHDAGQISNKEKHDTEMAYRAAERRLEQARAAYEKAVNGPRQEVIAQQRQSVAAQRARLAQLKRDLEKTQIRAPFAGAVTAKHTEEGEWIDEGGNVCDLIALDTVRVRMDVPERAIPFARKAAPATIEAEAINDVREAKITRVIPLASANARTFPVEVDLANESHDLLPGMFVWAYVPSGPAGTRLMVDRDAVVPRGTSKFIYVIRPGPDGAQVAEETLVETGLEMSGAIEVQARGLQAGDLVVTRANERLRNGAPVVVQQDAPPPTRPQSERTERAQSPAAGAAAHVADREE